MINFNRQSEFYKFERLSYDGRPISGQSNEEEFQVCKCNGKEMDRMYGLDWLDYGARMDNPAIGLWTQMDPLAEKYYNINPYVYCGGDPVNRIDIHGDSIYIENGKERILYYKGIEYYGKNQYIQNAIKALNDIFNNGGESVMTDLISCSHQIQIKYGENKFDAAVNSRACMKTQLSLINQPITTEIAKIAGCGGVIYWNPLNEIGGPNEKGSTSRPAYIGLAHELGHAYSAIMGNANYDYFDPNNIDSNLSRVTWDEYSAMLFENKVRKGGNIPIRTCYTYDLNHNKFMPLK